jgi:hypothetical protein
MSEKGKIFERNRWYEEQVKRAGKESVEIEERHGTFYKRFTAEFQTRSTSSPHVKTG